MQYGSNLTVSLPLHSPSMSAETLRLLLIDDDALLRDRVLTPRLRQFGFEVMAIGHVGEMAQAIERCKPDIVLLDKIGRAHV